MGGPRDRFLFINLDCTQEPIGLRHIRSTSGTSFPVTLWLIFSLRAKFLWTMLSQCAKYEGSMARGKTGREPKARMDAYEVVFTALAHPARRRILLTLNFEGGSMTAGQIADVFEHAWPTTTRHIRVLESAGLLHHDRKGRTRVYHID